MLKNEELIIKEHSPVARMAARIMKTSRMAIVIGRVIHLYGIGKTAFLDNQSWVNHEKVHLQQFERYGFLRFIILYLWECCKHGYHNNKYEAEARAAE